MIQESQLAGGQLTSGHKCEKFSYQPTGAAGRQYLSHDGPGAVRGADVCRVHGSEDRSRSQDCPRVANSPGRRAQSPSRRGPRRFSQSHLINIFADKRTSWCTASSLDEDLSYDLGRHSLGRHLKAIGSIKLVRKKTEQIECADVLEMTHHAKTQTTSLINRN